MGNCFDCLVDAKPNDEEKVTVVSQQHESEEDAAERRKKLAEAAEKRKIEAESRGVKDPERLKREAKKRKAAEDMAATTPQNEGNLKWSVS